MRVRDFYGHDRVTTRRGIRAWAMSSRSRLGGNIQQPDVICLVTFAAPTYLSHRSGRRLGSGVVVLASRFCSGRARTEAAH